jgi:hypothetical protein
MESLPRLPASRVSLVRELARGSSGVIFSAFYRECECHSQDQRCTHTARTVCLKVTCVGVDVCGVSYRRRLLCGDDPHRSPCVHVVYT